jgi:Trypsin-like peptidase domain
VTNLERWKRCVVHLEAAADSVGHDEQMAQLRSFGERLQSGGNPPSPDEMLALGRGSRDKRYGGTAVFLQHENRRYLITARHVLTKEEDAKKYHGALLDKIPDDTRKDLIENWTFSIILRVPSLDEVLSDRYSVNTPFLMNLGAGTNNMKPYTFSTPETDLAIISLDQRNSDFADGLISAGYKPIGLDDVIGGPVAEGVDVVTIGYPGSVAVLGAQIVSPAEAPWAASVVSLPVFSWGRVAMSHEKISFFWVDMTIYPGNSGGPVIESDHLIGIVSEQAVVESVRVPFAKIARAALIPDLLSKQIDKDNYLSSRLQGTRPADT